MDKPKKILFDIMDIGGINEIRLTCVETTVDYNYKVFMTLIGTEGEVSGKWRELKDLIDIGAWGYYTARLNTDSSNKLADWFGYLKTQSLELQEYHRLEAIYGNKGEEK